MRVDNEEDEEEDMDVEIVSTSQYAGVRTRRGKVLVWSALGDNTLILKRDLCCCWGCFDVVEFVLLVFILQYGKKGGSGGR